MHAISTTTRPYRFPLRLLATAATLCLVVGCATTKPADYTRGGFDANAIGRIAILPVLDHRIDKTKELKLDKWLLPMAEKSLKKRGYASITEHNRAAVADISRDSLENPSPQFISSLPPASAKWVLVLALDASSSKMTFGSTGTAELSGYIFDKTNGTLVWRNKEIGRVGAGGLMGMMVKGLMEESAIQQAAMLMFQTLPDRK